MSKDLRTIFEKMPRGKSIGRLIGMGVNDEALAARAMVRMRAARFLTALYFAEDTKKMLAALILIRHSRNHRFSDSTLENWHLLVIRRKYGRFEIDYIVDRLCASEDLESIQGALDQCRWVITGDEYARLLAVRNRLAGSAQTVKIVA